MLKVLERSVNAGRVGLVFIRNKSFAMPRHMRVCGVRIPLVFPEERGVKGDFIACVIRNDYGLRSQMGAVRTILDIGANLGFFSLAARGAYPKATIHAYEPNPRILPYLEANTSQSDIGVFPSAVGAAAGKVSVIDDGPSNIATTRPSEDGAVEQAPLAMVISRLGGEVDLLKMDCEGAEWELFEAEKPWRSIREVRMEYHLQHSHAVDEVFRRLGDLGFTVTRHTPDQAWGIVWASNRFFSSPPVR